MSALCALAYTALAALPTIMHLALTFGAPLGAYTMGGQIKGRLPMRWRALSVLQALLLAGMSLTMLERGGVIALGLPPVLFWLSLALTLTTCAANNFSPSKPERRLWGPVTLGMAITALLLALL